MDDCAWVGRRKGNVPMIDKFINNKGYYMIDKEGKKEDEENKGC